MIKFIIILLISFINININESALPIFNSSPNEMLVSLTHQPLNNQLSTYSDAVQPLYNNNYGYQQQQQPLNWNPRYSSGGVNNDFGYQQRYIPNLPQNQYNYNQQQQQQPTKQNRFPPPRSRSQGKRKYKRPEFVFDFDSKTKNQDNNNKDKQVENNKPNKQRRNSCGYKKPELSFYIANGRQSREASWPWHVRVNIEDENDPNSQTACGGTVIDIKHGHGYIATAAHCYDGMRARMRAKLTNLYFIAPQSSNKKYYSLKATSVFVHQDYIPAMSEYEAKMKNTKAGPYDDIAIIKYEMDDEYSAHLSPICLPSTRSYNKWDFTQCKIMGHGFTSSLDEDKFIMPEQLQEADIDIAVNEECKVGIESETIKSKITENTVCIKGPMQPCVGDSGGPILCRGSHEYDDDLESMNWVLVGVTSFAVSTDYSNKCGYFKSAIFAEVIKYREWIDSIIRNNN